jgi:BolA protein
MTMEQRIKTVITENLAPEMVEVKNKSHLHAGHAGDNGTGESHFHLIVVSNAFEGKGKVERHRMVFSILQEEMKTIHALEIKAYSPSEAPSL